MDHLIMACVLYLLSAAPIAFLNGKLLQAGRWSAFRMFAVWCLAKVIALVPLAWVDFPLFSALTWPARAISLGFLGAVAGECAGSALLGALAGTAAGAGMAWALPSDAAVSIYRGACFACAAVCAASLLKRDGSRRLVAIGLLVYTLFPAISESAQVLEAGGWLRLVPTAASLVACAIWIAGSTAAARPLRRAARAR